MAEGPRTVEAIPHLGNGTGECGHVPAFEVRIDEGGEEKPSTARRPCPERPPIAIIGDMEAIGASSRPYIPDSADIPHTVDPCRPDMPDAYRIPGRPDGSGFAAFEAAAAYPPTRSII